MTIIAQQSQQSNAKARGDARGHHSAISAMPAGPHGAAVFLFFIFALRGEYIGPKMNQQFDKITK